MAAIGVVDGTIPTGGIGSDLESPLLMVGELSEFEAQATSPSDAPAVPAWLQSNPLALGVQTTEQRPARRHPSNCPCPPRQASHLPARGRGEQVHRSSGQASRTGQAGRHGSQTGLLSQRLFLCAGPRLSRPSMGRSTQASATVGRQPLRHRWRIPASPSYRAEHARSGADRHRRRFSAAAYPAVRQFSTLRASPRIW